MFKVPRHSAGFTFENILLGQNPPQYGAPNREDAPESRVKISAKLGFASNAHRALKHKLFAPAHQHQTFTGRN